MVKKIGNIILIAVFLSAVLIRVFSLNERPMHTDEAVNSIKFKYLLEKGEYKYDPVEYHGPSIYYLTLLSALTSGETKLSEINEFTLRIVPVITGILLILSLFLLKNIWSKRYLIFAILLSGLSPLLVFYNRYYIHETILVFFTFVFLFSFFKYFFSGKNKWVVFSGVSAGLAFATKETFIIALFAAVIAFSLTNFLQTNNKIFRVGLKQTVFFVISFLAIAVIFYSSFFTNPQGIIDSVKTLSNYILKAGNNTEHIYPFYYYFSLVFRNYLDGYLISEIFILAFAIVGMIFSFQKRPGKRLELIMFFISVFTAVTILIYSFIPYKTPWTMLTFWFGIILVSSYGLTKSFEKINSERKRFLYSVVSLIFIVHLGYQSYLTSYKYSSSPENPFTYSQPENGVKEIEKSVNDIISVLPKYKIFVFISMPEDDYWPLPWYLRKANNTAWNNIITEDVSQFDIILSSPRFEEELIFNLYEVPPPGKKNLYIPLFNDVKEIRPGVKISGFIKKDTYDEYLYLSKEN